MSAKEAAAKKAAVRRAWQEIKGSMTAARHPLVAICSSCKKMRTATGAWVTAENPCTAMETTHTVCPDCIRKLYPELDR